MADRGPDGSKYSGLVDKFCSVTGSTKDAAIHLLEACNGDLEMAIGMQMDGGGLPGATPSGGEEERPITDAATGSIEDEIRAPIPQKREVLVEEQQYAFRGRRRAARSVFDGFRDFQAETRQAEERARRGEAVAATNSARKQRTLEDLFRPPIDLMHKGSFHSAKEAGTAANKWLMVNIQNVQEFPCQVLNRDVWSQPAVRDTIKHNFIFWQVYSDSEDGKRYMQFYKIPQWPYVAIIDPQTGESLIEWNKLDATTILELISTFLTQHPKPDYTDSPPSKKSKRSNSIVDASEDSQLEAAIQASLSQTKKSPAVAISSDSDQLYDSSDDICSDNDLETFTDSDQEPEVAQKASPPRDDNSETKSETKKLSGSESNSDTDSSVHPKENTSQGKNGSQLLSKGKASKNSVVKNGLKCTKGSKKLCSTNESSLNVPSTSDVCEKTTEATSWKDYLGSETDDKTKLLIRFPDGKREPMTIPCSSKLRAVVEYVSEKEIDLQKHELVTNFPRRNLSTMDLNQTLQDSGLHPQETIFVQEKS